MTRGEQPLLPWEPRGRPLPPPLLLRLRLPANRGTGGVERAQLCKERRHRACVLLHEESAVLGPTLARIAEQLEHPARDRLYAPTNLLCERGPFACA